MRGQSRTERGNDQRMQSGTPPHIRMAPSRDNLEQNTVTIHSFNQEHLFVSTQGQSGTERGDDSRIQLVVVSHIANGAYTQQRIAPESQQKNVAYHQYY